MAIIINAGSWQAEFDYFSKRYHAAALLVISIITTVGNFIPLIICA